MRLLTCKAVAVFVIASGIFACSSSAGHCGWLPDEEVCPYDTVTQTTSDESHWCVAVDGGGVVHVAYEEDLGGAILYNRRDPALGWGTDCLRVSSYGTGYLRENPAITCDSQGNLFIAWQEEKTTNGAFTLCYRRYSTVSGWDSTDTVLDSPSDMSAYAPSVAMDDTGNVHIVWLRQTGTSTNKLLYRKCSPDVGWGPTKRLSVGVVGRSRHPAIVESQGTLHVVWDQYTLAEGRAIYYKRYTAGVGWDDVATKLNGVETGFSPSIAVDSVGDIHVVWTVWFSDEEWEIAYREWTSELGWDPVVTYVTDNDGVPSEEPAVASDHWGNAHVIWKDHIYYGPGVIYERVHSPESGWGGVTWLVGGDWMAESPDVITDTCGNLHLVWQDSRNGYCCSVCYMMWDAEYGGVDDNLVREDSGCLRLEATPNPFTHQIVVSYASPSPARETLKIYDVRGRVVTILAGPETGGQDRSVIWDGRDSSGDRLTPGIYFLEFRQGTNRILRKVVLLE
jgi:hypothetical protein